MSRQKANYPINSSARRPLLLTASTLLLAATGVFSTGCVTAVSIGVTLVGKAVDAADVKEHEKVLIGADLVRADERLGDRLDTLRDLDSDQAWVIYPVKADLLGKDRYVVEVAAERIVAFSRTEKNSDPKRDIPRALFLRSKVRGKPPAECATLLDMGDPLLAVRSDATGTLSQIYVARHFKQLSSPDYCILRFDDAGPCKDVEFLGIGASTKKAPLGT